MSSSSDVENELAAMKAQLLRRQCAEGALR